MSVILDAIDACQRGKHPACIGRGASGWFVMGESQFLYGYCMLLADPVVASLNDLQGLERAEFLHDWAALGDAIVLVTGCQRINYELLANVDPWLHAHCFPRFATEPEAQRQKPVWFIERPEDLDFCVERDTPLMMSLRAALSEAGVLVD